jgi:hypothetical protein
MKSRSSFARRALLAFVVALAVPVLAQGPRPQAPGSGVIVNGAPVPPGTIADLERIYRTPIAPGRYWYDPVSGAWGREGGPIAGQIFARLRLGGPLRADASNGTSRVFVNGRELTTVEVYGLQRACGTPVYRGRYWVDAQGRGGVEGGAAIFNLAACGQQQGARSSGGSSTRTYCDGAGNCSSHGLLGWVATTR